MRISDWSSDVCSSDLCEAGDAAWPLAPVRRTSGQADAQGAGTDCGHAASVQGRAGAGFQKPELTRSDGSDPVGDLLGDIAGRFVQRTGDRTRILAGDRTSTRLNSSH